MTVRNKKSWKHRALTLMQALPEKPQEHVLWNRHGVWKRYVCFGAVRALTRSRLVSIKWCSVEMRLGILHMERLNIFFIFFDAFIPCFASLVLPYLLRAPLLHAVVISLFPHEFLSGIQDEVSYCLGGPICALWASLHPHHPQRSRSAC